MKTINKPTNEQLQRLMNLIALPARMDDESIGDRFDFNDGNREKFIDDFCAWLKHKDRALYDKITNDDYSGVEYYFWSEPDGSNEIDDEDEDGVNGAGIAYRSFRMCAEYIYTHLSALEGVCEELKEFSKDEEYINEFDDDDWDNLGFSSKKNYLSELKKLFIDVEYGKKEASRIKNQKIFNGNLPDVKERVHAPKISKDDFWQHFFDALSWNEPRRLTMKDFMKANPGQYISKGNGMGLYISGSSPSLDDKKIERMFKEKFKPENEDFERVFEDISKFNLKFDQDDTYVDFIYVIDYYRRDRHSKYEYVQPFALCRWGRGEGHYLGQRNNCVQIDMFIFWDGESLRAFIPEKGNAINLDTMTYIYIDKNKKVIHQEDVDYLMKSGYSSPKKVIEDFSDNNETDIQYAIYVSESDSTENGNDEDFDFDAALTSNKNDDDEDFDFDAALAKDSNDESDEDDDDFDFDAALGPISKSAKKLLGDLAASGAQIHGVAPGGGIGGRLNVDKNGNIMGVPRPDNTESKNSGSGLFDKQKGWKDVPDFDPKAAAEKRRKEREEMKKDDEIDMESFEKDFKAMLGDDFDFERDVE